MTRPARLTVTALEDRAVPAAFGTAWPHTDITYSFAPDGTDVGGAPSELFSLLSARATAAEWQGAAAAAFQAWAVPANLNFARVPDDGRPVGSPGPVQRSPFVGDVRITARPLSDNVLAIANPFDLISTWSGEVVLNSNKVFDTDGSAGTYDLYTVLLHEVGHALGVAHRADPNSVMGDYAGPRAGLSAVDVADIQELYGARAADRFDGNNGNDTPSTASWLSYIRTAADLGGTDGTAGPAPFVAAGDVTTPADVDVYAYRLTTGATNPAVVVETGGQSSTRLRVSVSYQLTNGGGQRFFDLAATATPDASGRYVLTLNPPAGASWFYVRVEAAPGAGAFGVGSYRLATGNGLTAIPTGTYTTQLVTPGGAVTESADWAAGHGTNETLASATALGGSGTGADARWDYRGLASFTSAADVDVYQVRARSDSGSVLVVGVGTSPGGANPAMTVYDGRGNALPAEVLTRNDGMILIQLTGLRANATYFVEVRAADPTAWAGAEGYALGIDFRSTPVGLNDLAAGTLTAAQDQLARRLVVTRSTAFLFQLSATDTTDAAPTAARFTVLNSSGQAVFTTVAQNGETAVGDVLLPPDVYTIVITGTARDGSALRGLAVVARYLGLTDPVGPALTDGYAVPAVPTAAPATISPVKTAPVPAAVDPGFFWLAPAAIGQGFLAPTDLYRSPWW